MAVSISMTAPAETYRARRARLSDQLTEPAVFFAGMAPARNYPGNPHPFRANSTYLYFGGPRLEGAALVVEPQSDGSAGCTLFRIPQGVEDAVWFGEVADDATIASAAGLPQRAIADPDRLESLLVGKGQAVATPSCHSTREWIARSGLSPGSEEVLRAIIDMRLIKDEYEMQAMRRAATVTVEAHRAAMSATPTVAREADVAAAFHGVLVARECSPSFTPIISVHGEVLHSHGYPNALKSGSLLLVDAGAEEPGGYACDVTRTFPVNGEWTAMQRHLYETVLNAMQQAIAACVPGKRYRDVHDLAGRVICEGLVQADLLKGDAAELADRRAHTLFFLHGIGHLIGLDVHDMEDFGDLAGYAPGRRRPSNFGDKYLRLDRDLKSGMCLTIEPGIYLVPTLWNNSGLPKPFADVVNRPAVDALLKDEFGGIRIEETIHVTSAQPEILSRDLPSDPEGVARCLGRS